MTRVIIFSSFVGATLGIVLAMTGFTPSDWEFYVILGLAGALIGHFA